MDTPYDLVIFDFDGTLADSAAWFRGIMNQMAQQYGFRQISESELQMLRGKPNREIIQFMKVPMWKMPFIARTMREWVRRDIDQITLFPSADTLLHSLAERGITTAIVTSNSEENVRHILGEDIARTVAYYSCGSTLLGKASRFKSVMRQAGCVPERTLCIGDEVRDIEAGRKAGIRVGAVAWGYATAEILIAQQPDYLFTSIDAILSALTEEQSPGHDYPGDCSSLAP